MSFFSPLTPRNKDWFTQPLVEAEAVAQKFESPIVEPEKKLTDGDGLWKPKSLSDALNDFQAAAFQTRSAWSFKSLPMQRLFGITALDVYPELPAIDPIKLAKLEATEPRKLESPKREDRVPDLITPIVGWRCWRVTSKLSNSRYLRLRGLGRNTIWPTLLPLVAACDSRYRVDHEAPHATCGCGIWLFKDLETLKKAVEEYDSIVVLGIVNAWGRVIECENGWRAQFAYPKELWLLDEGLEQLGVEYGVPIRAL